VWGCKPRANEYCRRWEDREALLARASVFAPMVLCGIVWTLRSELPFQVLDQAFKMALLVSLPMVGLGLLQLGFSMRRQRILSRASNAVPPSPEQPAEAQPQSSGTPGRPRRSASIEQ
jgi:hypothetical protein